MTCQHCGKATNYDFEFCPVCGKPAASPEESKPNKCLLTKTVLWIFLAINIVFFTMLVITRLMETIDGKYPNEWWICIAVFVGGFITAQSLMVKYAPKIKGADRYNRLLCLPLLAVFVVYIVWLDLDVKDWEIIPDYLKWSIIGSYIPSIGSVLFALGMVLAKAKRRSAVPAVLIIQAVDILVIVIQRMLLVEEYKGLYTWDEAAITVGFYLVDLLMLVTAAMLMFPAPKEKKKIP